MTSYSQHLLTARERELLAQLIDARRRLTKTREELDVLKEKNRRLRNELRRYKKSPMHLRLQHAMRELKKKKPDVLSDEEWRMVLESRGICAS